MRIRFLLLALMTVSLVGCDSPDDQARARARAVTETKLAGFSGVAPDTGIVLRRLSVGPNLIIARDAAPDGSFLVGQHGPSGDIALIDPRSREIRLVNPRNTRSWDVGATEGNVVSPDGKRIAYNWFFGDDTYWGYQFRIVNVDGSDDRPLLENENREPLRENGFIGGFIEPWVWTADGWILGVGDEDWEPGRPETLMLISERDGETRTLREFGEGVGVGKSDLSPDGRYVVYQIRPEPGASQDIHILSIGSGRETQLAHSPSDELLLGWVPGQDAILFHADNDVWRLELSEGEAVGLPELLRADVWGMRPIGFSNEGLIYDVDIRETGLYSVSLDLEAGKAVGPVTQITGSAGMPTWSPDGRFLATRENGGIVIRTEGSGDRRAIPLPFRGVGNIQWHPEGGSIFFFGYQPSSDGALYELDLTTEEVSLVGASVGAEDLEESLSPDGRTRYSRLVTRVENRTERWIMAQDLETGAAHRVRGSESITSSRISVSPDGTMLAYRGALDTPDGGRSAIYVVPAAGGEARVVFSKPDGWGLGGSRGHSPWTPDGLHVLIGAVVPGEALTILKAPIDGGEPTTLWTYGAPDSLGEATLLDLNLSPDGRTAAFVWKRERQEIWLMQGY